MSLMPRSRLISDSPRSPRVAETAIAGAEHEPRPPGGVQHEGEDRRRDDHAGGHRAGEALPRLLGADGRRHRVPAEQHAGRVPADVAAHDGRDEGEHPARAVVGDGEQHREAGQQRDVHGDEDAGRGVPEVAGGPVGEPPQDDGEHGEQEADDQAGGAAGPGQELHRQRARPGAGSAAGGTVPPSRARMSSTTPTSTAAVTTPTKAGRQTAGRR